MVERMEMDQPNSKSNYKKSLCCRSSFSKNKILKYGGQVRRGNFQDSLEGLCSRGLREIRVNVFIS